LAKSQGDLHLAREREHVREQPRFREHLAIELLRRRVRDGLVENAGKTLQRA